VLDMRDQYGTQWTRVGVALIAGLLSIGAAACAIPKLFSEPFEQGVYKDIMERQAEGMPVEEDKLKNLPAMTARDYESTGDSYLSRNDTEQALTKYETALAMEPNSWPLHYKAGLVLLKMGSAGESLAHFDAIVRIDPMNAHGYEGRGRALLAMHEHEQAEVALRRAVELDSGLWKAHEALGVLYDQLGTFDESVAEYRAALAIRPNDPSVLNNLGVALYLKKDYGKAIDTFQRALSFTAEADRPRTYNNLARAYAKTGSYSRAFDSFRRASNSFTAYNNLGLLYLEEGKPRQAASCFQKAIEESPGYYAAANENLATARESFPKPDSEEGVRVAAVCP